MVTCKHTSLKAHCCTRWPEITYGRSGTSYHLVLALQFLDEPGGTARSGHSASENLAGIRASVSLLGAAASSGTWEQSRVPGAAELDGRRGRSILPPGAGAGLGLGVWMEKAQGQRFVPAQQPLPRPHCTLASLHPRLRAHGDTGFNLVAQSIALVLSFCFVVSVPFFFLFLHEHNLSCTAYPACGKVPVWTVANSALIKVIKTIYSMHN